MSDYQRFCRLPLAPRSKRPLLVRWSTIAPDDPVIERIFAENPTANIGLRLDGLVVIDCDTPATVAWWCDHGPPTPVMSQGNPERRSFWYRVDLDDEPTSVRCAGLDVKTGPGHQCVVPPSIHPHGLHYRWLGDDLTDPFQLPPIPGTVLTGLLGRLTGQEANSSVPEGGWDAILEGEGRDKFLTAAAGFLRSRGASVEAVRLGLSHWNQAFCEPRMTSRDLDRIAKSSGRWEAGAEFNFEELPPWDQ